MVSHHHAKFGSHRCCGIGEMMFLVVEGQDSTCPRMDPPLLFISKAHGACHGHTHKISGGRHNNLTVCPMKDSGSWSHMSIRTIDEIYLKDFC